MIPDIGSHAYGLGIADAFVLACMHRNGHLAQGEPERLIWLYDIYLMLKQMDVETEPAFKFSSTDIGCNMVKLVGTSLTLLIVRENVFSINFPWLSVVLILMFLVVDSS